MTSYPRFTEVGERLVAAGPFTIDRRYLSDDVTPSDITVGGVEITVSAWPSSWAVWHESEFLKVVLNGYGLAVVGQPGLWQPFVGDGVKFGHLGEGPITFQAVRTGQVYLPHRPPFLLIDYVDSVAEDAQSVVCYRTLQDTDPWFAGHFPGYPVQPGVMTVEAMAQAAAPLLTNNPKAQGKLAMLQGLDAVQFHAPAFPGDVLRLESRLDGYIRGIKGTIESTAHVGDTLICSGRIRFVLVPPRFLPNQGKGLDL